MRKTLKMKQLTIGQWEGTHGNNFSIIGLSEDGLVFKYEKSAGGWVPYRMVEANPKKEYDNRPAQDHDPYEEDFLLGEK